MDNKPDNATRRKPFPYKQETARNFARYRKNPDLKADACAKYTYFMRDKISGLIKIGMSYDPSQRRQGLSGSGWRDMEILLELRGGDLEMSYHRHFEDLCAGGEWFHPHPDILAEIARLTTQEDN